MKGAMKKIIELAERVCNARAPFITSDLYELDKAIGERRELEQTPITEEWLEEHGFVPNSTLYKWEIWSKDNGIFFSVTKEYGKWYITDTCMEVSFLADLYDACELCGIELN